MRASRGGRWLTVGVMAVCLSRVDCGGRSHENTSAAGEAGESGIAGAAGAENVGGGGVALGGQGGAEPRPPDGGVGGGEVFPCDRLPKRLWRLTHGQFENTLNDVFGFAGTLIESFPVDGRESRYRNQSDQLAITPILSDYYATVASEVADHVIAHNGEFLDCPIETLSDGDCLESFVRTIGSRAWRRPLSEEEVADLLALYEGAAAMDPRLGLRQVVVAMIVSDHLLFRSEQGSPDRSTSPLTSYERASWLSYTLWDSPPDAVLLSLAESGALNDVAVMREQAGRLLQDPKARPVWVSFVNQWLGVDTIANEVKDAEYPEFTPELVQEAMLAQERFVGELLFNPDGEDTLRALLSSREAYLGPLTAPLYGLAPPATEITRVSLNPDERIGIWTQLPWLSTHAGPNDTDVVNRGVQLLEQLVCFRVPPSPPVELDESIWDSDEYTTREKLATNQGPACASCHVWMDQAGLSLETYDTIGRYRRVDSRGRTIDPSGTFRSQLDTEIQFEDFVDLVEQLVETLEVPSCFTEQYLSYATGLPSNELPACLIGEMDRAFAGSVDFPVTELIVAATTSQTVLER